MPIWKTRNYWPVVVKGDMFAEFVNSFKVFNPVHVSNSFSESNIFVGRKKFDMIAIYVNGTKNNAIKVPKDC